MMQYTLGTIYTFYFLLIMTALLSTYMGERARIKTLFFLAVAIGMFYGMRDISTGIDTDTYVLVYLSQENWFEPGFNILGKIIYFFFHENVSAYLSILSLLMSFNMALTYKIILQKSKYICLAYVALYIMPYMILFHLNVIRQGLAVSFFLLGYVLWYKNPGGGGYLINPDRLLYP